MASRAESGGWRRPEPRSRGDYTEAAFRPKGLALMHRGRHAPSRTKKEESAEAAVRSSREGPLPDSRRRPSNSGQIEHGPAMPDAHNFYRV